MLITDEIIEKFEDGELKEQIRRLAHYGAFCELQESKPYLTSEMELNVGGVSALLDFYQVFDGGHIFDTDIFKAMSTGISLFDILSWDDDDDDDDDEDDEDCEDEEDDEKDLSLTDTNDDDYRQRHGLPEYYLCFAKSSTGTLYCVDKRDFKKSIYEWDEDSGEVIEVWDNFAKWLKNEIDLAEIDIEDGLLKPR